MPSTASPSVLAELQAAGENLNTWGDTRLNTALKMLEAAGHGLTSHTLTGNVSLTYTNYTQTNGSDFVQKIAAGSDGSYTLTLGGYERSYLIWNASSYSQTIACSGVDATVYAGEIIPIYCDGTDVVRLETRRVNGNFSVGSNRVTDLATGTANTDAVNKAQMDAALLDLSGGNLPSQGSSTRGAAIVSDGTDANWVRQIAGTRITSTTQAVANAQPYYCDLSGGAFTLTLPASPQEMDYVIADTSSDAPANNLTVGRNGETIEGASEDFTADLGPRRFIFVYLNSDWKAL
ncbi:MAG: hypothetical protein VX529_11000 [Pseudomonadota bacterium]|nr:hypothetical protein [Pseudomonadota bacterium]